MGVRGGGERQWKNNNTRFRSKQMIYSKVLICTRGLQTHAWTHIPNCYPTSVCRACWSIHKSTLNYPVSRSVSQSISTQINVQSINEPIGQFQREREREGKRKSKKKKEKEAIKKVLKN